MTMEFLPLQGRWSTLALVLVVGAGASLVATGIDREMPGETGASGSEVAVSADNAVVAESGPVAVVNPDGTTYDPEAASAAREAEDAPEDDPALADEADPLDQPELPDEMPDPGAAEREGTVAAGTALE